jgi:hypothetical protein
MRVDLLAAPQKTFKIVFPDSYRERKPDRRPELITAAHPIPKAKHAIIFDAEGRDLIELR